jgi:hypothetical protein
MLVHTPPKHRRKGISGGQPATRKKRKFQGSKTDGSAPTYGRRINKDPKTKQSKLPAFTPWKVVLAGFLIGICGILYIGHVFSTQKALAEVNELELEYKRAERIYHQKRLLYERMTGPKEIYGKARELGFVNAGPADQILYIRNDSE